MLYYHNYDDLLAKIAPESKALKYPNFPPGMHLCAYMYIRDRGFAPSHTFSFAQFAPLAQNRECGRPWICRQSLLLSDFSSALSCVQ